MIPPICCIHATTNQRLCPKCEAEYLYDPIAWLEYGDHPAGLEAQQRLRDEHAAMAAEVATRVPVDDSDWPL